MRRAALGAVALLLALAGCGGDPKADPSPSPTPSSPATSPVSTTPSTPVLPEEAKADTKAGAIAFVKYYVELINHAQATGDVSPLRSVEGTRCESCRKVRGSITQIYANGGSIEGGTWRPHLNVALRNNDGSWLVSGYLRFDPERVQKSSASAVETSEGGSASADMTVQHVAGSWKVIAWSRES
jgi:hypothetical protein